ncbi:TonB-dependent receptor [Roseateles paludis]|uniref:TonB-dependent receptor n=1 Tax=Roseateles paludis TaxID=3145238 RepID=A0ABV0G0S3_9BURK
MANKMTLSALGAAVALLAVSTAYAQQAAANADADEAGAPRAKEDSVRLGTITIVGEGNNRGAGQILNEDASKSRSTVTKAATEKDRATGNPYQALALLPGISTFNYDATGLFGGGLTVRGFNSDQLGFTVNGVPVNDSGNFAVYPQEYADQENLCTQSVTQGSPDVESPHAGATGGNVTVNSCDPENARRFRVSQTLGGLSLTRSFIRFDTGRIMDDKLKMFFSYSHTKADKWKGKGTGKKDHFDAAFRWDIDAENVILGSVLYNYAINNNIYSVSLAQLDANGYYYDFGDTFVGHLPPVKGTAQRETSATPGYYKLSFNPFRNAIVSLSGSFKLAENTSLKIQPYLWYGFGNGALQQQTALSETAFLNKTTGKTGAGVDLNGDGDTLDTVIVARGSVTRTSRPGVTTELNTLVGDHQIRAGLWIERADHRQTQPAVPVDNDGNALDIWLEKGQILRPDGTPYQGRDWQSISTASQLYISDSVNFLSDKATFTFGLRAPRVSRSLTSNANETFTTGYKMVRRYSDVLPQAGVRVNLDKANQVYVNLAKNFRAPPNFALTGNNVRLVGSEVQLLREALPETSVMTDLGYRYQAKALSLSATLFNSDFKNRQSNAFDPVTQNSTYQNVGRVNNRGLELEAGSAPFLGGFTAYGSLTVQKTKVKDDFQASATVSLPTTGKQLTLTPETMIGASLQYASGPLYARVKAKHTGRQYATLMNDEEVPSYTLLDFDAGYNFGNVSMLSNVQMRFNVSNITNQKYRTPSSGTTINAVKYGTVNANTVFYYLGAPRLASLTLSADFK